MSEKAQSLATGADLTPATFADFIERLRHDCEGDGVKDHYTACAIFIVQSKQLVSGIDREFCEDVVGYIEDSHYFSPDELFDDLHDLTQAELVVMGFREADQRTKWDLLEDEAEVTVTGYAWRWDYVSSHFTKDAADAYVRRKSHDHRHGLRVFVDAQVYCWEYEAIKKALIDGRLVLKELEAAKS